MCGLDWVNTHQWSSFIILPFILLMSPFTCLQPHNQANDCSSDDSLSLTLCSTKRTSYRVIFRNSYNFILTVSLGCLGSNVSKLIHPPHRHVYFFFFLLKKNYGNRHVIIFYLQTRARQWERNLTFTCFHTHGMCTRSDCALGLYYYLSRVCIVIVCVISWKSRVSRASWGGDSRLLFHSTHRHTRILYTCSSSVYRVFRSSS